MEEKTEEVLYNGCILQVEYDYSPADAGEGYGMEVTINNVYLNEVNDDTNITSIISDSTDSYIYNVIYNLEENQ